MANVGPNFDWTAQASGDMSSDQYKLVSLSTSGQLTVITARGARPAGVFQDNTTAAGIPAKYVLSGVSKVVAGDSSGMENGILPGTPLISSSQGAAVPTTNNIGNVIIGFSLGTLSTGSTGIITAMINISGAASSA